MVVRTDLHRQFERSPAYGNCPPRGSTVGTGEPTVLVQQNARRKLLTIINDSDTTMYVAKADRATLNTGFRLNANGGVFTIESDAMGYLWTGPVAVICGSSSKNVTITEET